MERITLYVELWAWKMHNIQATIYPSLYNTEYSEIIKTQSDFDELVDFFYKECLTEENDALQSRQLLLLRKTLSDEIGKRLYVDFGEKFYSKLLLIQQFLFVMENMEIKFEKDFLGFFRHALDEMVETVSFMKEE
ncbi:hypothetical protein V6Z05_01295 [Leptospira venezuelensis]|uniref:hypothetical protein n=1 Tax=Leptospira venezuelensis TaxID=1958811 RepID=UPI0012FFB853|nr:hypothetical protein [Leptospira venezuelensis]